MESNLQSWPCSSGSSCHDGKILLPNWLCRDQMHSQAKATSLILLLKLLVQATLLQVCVTCQSEQKGLLNYFILLRDVQVIWYGYNVELRWKLRSIPGPRPSFLVGNMLDVRQLTFCPPKQIFLLWMLLTIHMRQILMRPSSQACRSTVNPASSSGMTTVAETTPNPKALSLPASDFKPLTIVLIRCV